MKYGELRIKLIKELEQQLQEITNDLLMEAEGNGIDFDFTINDKKFNIKMTSEYDEEKNEYIKEEYEIN